MVNLGQYLAQQLLEAGEDIQPTPEKTLQESPPVDDMNDDYYDYVEQNRSKIEKAAFDFNFPIEDMLLAFNGGREIVLNDDMWKNMKNTKSYKMKTLEDAISHALKIGIDPKPYIEYIKQKKLIPLPLVLQYSPTDYYLVGGEVVLSIYKSLGVIPTVLLGNITPQKQTSSEYVFENLDKKKLDESQTATLGEFIKYAIQNLGIQQPPTGLTLSYNTDDAQQRSSFGTFDTGNNKIWLYVKNRNMADILRTLAHELVHRKQAEDGRLNINSGQTGSEIENEANAQAGILLRNFGKTNKHIYETLLKEGIYGDYLFGDKESGAKVGWYEDEMEKDTPAESELFSYIKKYVDSEANVYSNINLDKYVVMFRKLKKEYPDIADPKLSPSDYIYRGTIISEEKAKELFNLPNKEETKNNIIILNQKYSSRRQISSWSTKYYSAASFAMGTAERKGEGIPIVMRAKVSDAELFFNPKFMNKLSDQLEDEVFNATNPISVDIMFIKYYEDEFQDIESSYLHTKVQEQKKTTFNNWKVPSLDQLKQEFRVEHELKGNDFFDDESEFLQAIKNGRVITVTPAIDAQIGYRSQTSSKEELLDLIRSYRSYPKYRNEETIQSLYDAFETNQSIDLPIVIEFTNGSKRIFSGNTRMDIAFQLGINPKALLIKSNR